MAIDHHKVARVLWAFGSLLGLTGSGCAPSATQLDPRHLPPGENTVFGQVRVFKDAEEVTHNCNVSFHGDGSVHQTVVPLADSGWVFVNLPTGRNTLGVVRCSFVSVDDYFARLSFDVAEDMPTYIGALRFELRSRVGEHLARALRPAFTGSVIDVALEEAATPRPERFEPVTLQDRSDEALQEYVRRFGPLGQLSFSLAGEEPEGKPMLRRDDARLTVETRLNGATLQWLGLVRADKQRLAWRLQRSAQIARLHGCNQSELSVDGHVTRAPLAYKWVPSVEGFRELVQSDIDAATLTAISSSNDVTFSICGYRQRLTPRGALAARTLLTAYESELAKLGPTPAEPSTLVNGTPAPTEPGMPAAQAAP